MEIVGLVERRSQTAARVEQLRAELQESEARAAGKACVYATGSFGRGEASAHSDLDLFIVGKSNDKRQSLLRRLDEICIKADLIKVTRKLGIPEFTGDGKYLAHYSVSELTKTPGMPEDDVENTFTARSPAA
jgi:predicted nucleotidyltransferase